jgi:hypothetical protein
VRARRAAADLFVLLLAIWLLWPQHRGGYGLGHDLVFTPHQPLNAGSIGLGSTSPRAVPLDALVALAGKLLGGALTGRFALLLPLLAAGWGTIRLLNSRCLPAMLLVGGLALWNPYVIERLALGQWALLWAYGALPWLVRAASRIRRGEPGWAGLVLALAACAITPTGAIIGAVVAVTLGWPGLRRGVPLLVAAVLAQLPWLLPALLSTATATSDPRAVAAFAARSERPGGAVLSLLGLGGIWSADVTPASRGGALGYLSTALVVLALLFGARLVARPRLAWLAAAGFVLAAAATVPGLSALLRWAVRELPGAGLLRDGQKWLMPFVLLVILSAGAIVSRLASEPFTSRFGPDGQRPWRLLLALVAVALPLLLLPDAPATLRAPLTPVHYPAGWQAAAEAVRGSDTQVLVLPFASYRSFGWAPGRTVIDPAPRLLPAETVVDDRLVVNGEVLGGEDRTAAMIGQLLADAPGPARLADALAAQGIGWVLVEDTPGPALPDLSGLTSVLDEPGVRLYRVPGTIEKYRTATLRSVLVITTDLLLAVLVLLAIGAKAGSMGRRLLHSPVTTTSEEI